MKALKILRRTSALRITEATVRGGFALITIGDWTGTAMWGTDEDGWEHVSVSPYAHTRTPSWDDMCRIKDIFWDATETVFQIHPPKSKYTNIMDNCLHLWRPKTGVHGMNPEWDEED